MQKSWNILAGKASKNAYFFNIFLALSLLQTAVFALFKTGETFEILKIAYSNKNHEYPETCPYCCFES